MVFFLFCCKIKTSQFKSKKTPSMASATCGTCDLCTICGTVHDADAIMDRVWGWMSFPAWVHCVINTCVFQRLGYLKQTGPLDRVLPLAVHMRKEHCIGTAWLAQRMVTHLKTTQPELGITDPQVAAVVLAGLCHDLGHGPGSHSFEDLMKAVGHPEWHHEAQTCKLIRHMVHVYPSLAAYITKVLGVDLDVVGAMIQGVVPEGWPRSQAFLFEIVSNSVCGLDVDKCDYVTRDLLVLGMQGPSEPGTHHTVPVDHIISNAMVVVGGDGEAHLGWPQKAFVHVWAVFQGRAHLHLVAYQLPDARAAQAMLTRALALVAYQPLLVGSEGTMVSLVEAALHADPTAFVCATDVLLSGIVKGQVPETRGVSAESTALFAQVSAGKFWRLKFEEKVWDHCPSDAEKDAVLKGQDLSGVVFMDFVNIHGGKGVSVNPMTLVPRPDADADADGKVLDVTLQVRLRVYCA